MSPDQGQFEWGTNVIHGYFPQDHTEILSDRSANVLETVWGHDAQLEEAHVRGILGSALFTGDDVYRSIERLSGGEAARTILSILTIQKPNVLLIDEPTNHMDIATADALVQALEAYEGTVILVSHDRNFLSKIATRVIEVRADSFNPYDGTWDEFVASQQDDRFDRSTLKSASPSEKSSRATPTSPKSNRTKPRVNTFKVTKELESLVLKIEKGETRLDELQETFCDPDFYKSTDAAQVQSLEQELKVLEQELPLWTDRWAELETLLEED